MAKTKRTLWTVLVFWLIVTATPVYSAEVSDSEFIYLKNGLVVECDKAWIASKDTVRCKKGDDEILYSPDEVDLEKTFGESAARRLEEEKEEKRLFRPKIFETSRLFTKLAPEIQYVDGHSTYRISFDDTWENGGHGESELEWPISSWFAGIHLLVGNSHHRFSLRWLVSISDDAGTMKDSDWIENDTVFGYPSHPGKDLYGEVDARLDDAVIFDVSYAYNFSLNKRFSIGPVVGYSSKKLQWSGWNLVQRNFGPYVDLDYTDTQGWEWIRYEVSYRIPYVGVNSEILFGKFDQFGLNMNLMYSNWVDAPDKDTHLYPDWDADNPGYDLDKISEGDCEGKAYIMEIGACWHFRPNWSLDLSGNYINIDADGPQTQEASVNGVSIWRSTIPIKETITSSYWSAIFRISYYAF